MSITSRYEVDRSPDLAKRFACLAVSYMDDPRAARAPLAQVPLENLFRMLEMYRYAAFDDKPHRGVLTPDMLGSPFPSASTHDNSWHITIKTALDKARLDAFPAQEPTEEVVRCLEDGLRQLSQVGSIAAPMAAHAKRFFTTFAASI